MTGKRQFFSYTAENLRNAIRDVRDGMPVLQASKMYNVPRTTLRHKLCGESPETMGKVGPECVLGNDVEKELCEWIKNLSQMGFPINKDGLAFSVKKIVTDLNISSSFKDNVPGGKWFKLFLRRHPELSLKQAEYINKARANITPEKIRRWFQEILELLGNERCVLEDPKRVWNLDETALYLNPAGNTVLAEKGKHCYGTSANSDKENITTLICVNASGEFAPPLTLYKFERLPSNYAKVAPPNWGIGKSKNGWMTSETFYEYFTNVFYPFLVKEKYTLPVIVFLDGHSSHLNMYLSRFCKEKGIILVCLYPNTTHILQPLDVSLFHPLKVHWKKTVRQWKIKNGGKEIRKLDVPRVLYDIITNEDFTKTIQNGFRRCGLYPFTSDNVDYSRCTLKEKPEEEPDSQTSSSLALTHLEYLESKIEGNILKQFVECLAQNTTPIEMAYTKLYEVWAKFKDDNKSRDNSTENVLECIEDSTTIEFPFPEWTLDENTDALTEFFGNDDVLLLENVENGQNQMLDLETRDLAKKEVTNEGTKTLTEEEFININHEFGNDSGNGKEEEKSKLNKDSDLKTQFCAIDLKDKTELINKPIDSSILLGTKDISSTKHHALLTKDPVERLDEVQIKDKDGLANEELNQNSDVQIIEENLKNEKNHCDVSKKDNTSVKKNNILSNILIYPSSDNSSPRTKKKREYLPSVLTSSQWLQIAQEKEKEKKKVLEEKEDRKRKRAEQKKMRNGKALTVRERKRQCAERKVENPRPKVSDGEMQDSDTNDEADDENILPEKNVPSVIPVGLYVVVKFEGIYYPGLVTKIGNTPKHYYISAMERSGSDWKWPTRKDEILYEWEEIKEIIECPKEKNNRGVFSVPEMTKYNKP